MVADDGRDRLVDRYQQEFADAIIGNIPGASSKSDPVPRVDELIDGRSFLAAVSAGYYSVHPFDVEMVAGYEALVEQPRLTGERYVTILEIDDVDYQQLVEQPIVVPPGGG